MNIARRASFGGRPARNMVMNLRALKKSLGSLTADTATRLVSASADIALVVDLDGVIEDVSIANDELPRADVDRWIGKPWEDTVTVESRPKIRELLDDAYNVKIPRWRQVNHPSSLGVDLPVRYSALQLGQGGRVVALGRELRAMAQLQRHLVDAQQSMEREYVRLRDTETRYRVLFQKSKEGVVIIDAASLRIIEVNAAAIELLGKSAKRAIGRNFLELLEPASVRAAQNMIAIARSTGNADDVRVQLSSNGTNDSGDTILSPSLFRQDHNAHVLIRLSKLPSEAPLTPILTAHQNLQRVVEGLPDGFVVTDPSMLIQTANAAFLDLAQLASVGQARNEKLDQYLGRSPLEFNGLISNLKDHGSVRNFATVVRGQYGVVEDVEVSAVAVMGGNSPCFGFTVRPLFGRRTVENATPGRQLPHSAKQLTELVGRVPMKSIVRETTDLIERLCIEAALELVGENRASAAEMLGLSRQSLYVKLRRYGMVDANAEEN
jgi:transcriptional regulator PpsR